MERKRNADEYVLKSEAKLIIQNHIRSMQMNDYGNDDGIPQLYRAMDMLDNIPSAKVKQEIHGKWYLHPDGSGTCDQCGRRQNSVWDMDNWQNYCGHCGADMRGEISDA